MRCPKCRRPSEQAGLECSATEWGEDVYYCPCGHEYSSTEAWASDHPEHTCQCGHIVDRHRDFGADGAWGPCQHECGCVEFVPIGLTARDEEA